MTSLLTDNLPLLAGAPNGIQKLRELILELAVRGKLVPQDPSDEPAGELLKRIAEEKARLVAECKIKKQKPLTEIGEDEKSFVLPAGWAWQRFADFALDVSTGPFGSLIHQSDYVDGGVPLVNPSHMIDGRIVADQAVSLSIEMAASLASYRLSPGDMVMARRGEVGRVALVTEAEDGWLCGTGSFVLRFIPEVSRAYVWTLFRCNSVRTYLAGAAVGTTMVNLNHGILLKMPIAVPPLAEQHRIVAKVDELMALCDRLEASQADAASAHARLVQALLDSLTEASDADDFAVSWQRLAEHFHSLFTSKSSIDALKQTLLQLAVMGKLVPQDPSDEPASELLKRIAEEKARQVAEGKIRKQKPLAEIGEEETPFELPQGWQWTRKAEVFNFLNGYAFKSEWFKPEGIRLLRNVNVSHGVANWKDAACISEEQAAEFQGFLLAENDVVLTLDRPIISTGLKYAVISSSDLPCLLLQRVAKIAPYAGAVSVGYLSAWLNSRFFVDSIDPGRSNGVPHISTNQVASMPFALPPLAEQHRIVAKVDQLLSLCDQLKTRLTQARQLHERLAGALVEQAVA